MKPSLPRRIAAVAAILGLAAGVAAASPRSSDDPRTLVTMNSGKYRIWIDDYGQLWCGGTCGGYCCAIVPLTDPVGGLTAPPDETSCARPPGHALVFLYFVLAAGKTSP